MTNPKEGVSFGKELEPKSAALLAFVGFNHVPINVQTIDRTVEDLESHLNLDPNVSVTLVEEYGLISDSSRKRILSGIRDHGYLRYRAHAILDNMHGYHVSEKDVDAFLIKVRQSDTATVIDSGLIREGFIQQFYLSARIDALRLQYGFSTDCEYHSSDVDQRVAKAHALEAKFANEATGFWNAGDFDEFLKRQRLSLYQSKLVTDVRDQSIVSTEKKVAKGLLKQGQRFKRVYLFGRTHYRIPQMIAQKLGPKADVETVSNYANTYDMDAMTKPVYEILRGNALTDEVVARSFLAGALQNYIQYSARTHRKVGTLALMYETIISECSTIVTDLPLDQLRRLSQTKEKPANIIKNSQSANEILQFLAQ